MPPNRRDDTDLCSFLIQPIFGTDDMSHVASGHGGRQPKAASVTSANFAQSFEPLSGKLGRCGLDGL